MKSLLVLALLALAACQSPIAPAQCRMVTVDVEPGPSGTPGFQLHYQVCQ